MHTAQVIVGLPHAVQPTSRLLHLDDICMKFGLDVRVTADAELEMVRKQTIYKVWKRIKLTRTVYTYSKHSGVVKSDSGS